MEWYLAVCERARLAVAEACDVVLIPAEVLLLRAAREREREFFIGNLLVRIHFIIVMIRWTGLAPWECCQNTAAVSSAAQHDAPFLPQRLLQRSALPLLQ